MVAHVVIRRSFNDEVGEEVYEDFDFESNLNKFDKAAVFAEIEVRSLAASAWSACMLGTSHQRACGQSILFCIRIAGTQENKS